MQSETNMVRTISLFILSPQMIVSGPPQLSRCGCSPERKLLILGFYVITKFYR